MSACQRVFAQKRTKKYSQLQKDQNRSAPMGEPTPYFWYCLLPVTIRIKTGYSIVRSYISIISYFAALSTGLPSFWLFSQRKKRLLVHSVELLFGKAVQCLRKKKKRAAADFRFGKFAAARICHVPNRSRTCGLPLRRGTLYPTELSRRILQVSERTQCPIIIPQAADKIKLNLPRKRCIL